MHTSVHRATAPTGIRRLVAAVSVRRAADPTGRALDRPLPHRQPRHVPPPVV